MIKNEASQITRTKGRDVILSKYHVNKEPIGSGSYGLVYAGEDKITKKKVAIKKITKCFKNTVDTKRILREISLLRMLKEHPNIISLEYIATSTSNNTVDEIYLVFERYDCDLTKIIKSRQLLSTAHIQYFMYQILCGIYSIHAANLVHRDLKPSNILVNSNCALKICDFGLARAIQNLAPPIPYNQLTGYVVTRWYRSPELLLGCYGAVAPADMWSIGCILAELLLRKPLFPGETSFGTLDLIFKFTGTPDQHDCEWINNESGRDYIANYPTTARQNFQQKFNGADASALDLLEKLLELNPTKRITAEQALLHPFVRPFYHAEEMLTLPLKPRTAIDEHSLKDYYQFETALDGPVNHSSYEVNQWVCDLIQKETARYTPELSSASAVTLSNNTTSSFFYHSPQTQSDNAILNPTSDNLIIDATTTCFSMNSGNNP